MSGPVAQAIGDVVGLGDQSVTIWDIAKWPVMLGIVIVMVAVLYYATPNVRQPKFRWVSVGAAVAILIWVLASVAFGFYVSNFGSYNKTYGSLAGVIVFLLWLWITNLALLFGAEIDAELERARELQAGIRGRTHPPAAAARHSAIRQGRGEARGEGRRGPPAAARRRGLGHGNRDSGVRSARAHVATRTPGTERPLRSDPSPSAGPAARPASGVGHRRDAGTLEPHLTGFRGA